MKLLANTITSQSTISLICKYVKPDAYRFSDSTCLRLEGKFSLNWVILNHTKALYIKKLTSVISKIDRIPQKSENPVNQNAPKFTKLLEPCQTKLTKMKQSYPKFTKIN